MPHPRTKATITLHKSKRPWRRTQQFYWVARSLNGQTIASNHDLHESEIHTLVMAVQVTDGTANSFYDYSFHGWTGPQMAAAEDRLGRSL